MDQPATKKRRLAPKVEPQPSPSHPPQPPPPSAASYAHESTPSQHYQPQDIPPPPPERHEFESFARHLQDAAMLIYRQSQRSPHTKVSVLLLRWEDDTAAELDLVALDHVLRERYAYRTERWIIPAMTNASMKLGVRMSSFLESAGPDHLFIIHYAGHSFVASDKQLYWASNTKQDAPKLRWNGFRCIFEESPSDILLLLDSGVVHEPSVKGGSSTKQIIAAGTPDHYSREPGARSFTANLTEAFLQLGNGRPFTTELLYQEAARSRQHELLQSPGLPNGIAGKGMSMHDKLPMLFAITTGKGQGLSLCPLTPSSALGLQLQSPKSTADTNARISREDNAIHPSAVADLTFDEPRVLVCTTFVGEASPDMSSFHHWLHNTPAIGSKIAVEGMFLGPPTMLLISMPVAVWNVVQHDKVCCFLGYVNSHNMTHLYKRLVGSMSINKASAKDMEDGRMLLEAREVATSTPAIHRHLLPETPVRPDSLGRIDQTNNSHSAATPAIQYANTTPGTAASRKDDVEDSAEMQEAAEQLKALSHVRHVGDDTPPSTRLQPSPSIRATDPKTEERSLVDVSMDDARYHGDAATPSARPKPGRRSIQKPIPKQETRCNHCSHAPFKDSSSLRKHIAAAHTRPFPCAFSFAGCPSTFGSKNEWKRHIASQHLCLQYYRCSSCPQSSIEGKGNEFNRKDLFTQHLRRMHAPFAIKKALAKGDSKLQVEWETHVKDMQQSCLVTRRRPPQSSACPKPDCASVFEGPTSWDEWTEHVGRHMEKGEADRLGVDRLLAKWALDEGIIERKEDGEYRLCSGNGNSGERENNQYHSDGNKRDPEERTIVAASTIVEKMDVD
ncbi:hypothetical protein F5B22DRAFT_651213 [Xylaria bambusicola]|uniref:uncharacterized protein n=1 Tax=Xylaria bambusicola TaxID=326684 RepID=UPI002008ACF6|nr:uncharacterized protein F5B22DRAFT_651213 [Xylaria bambusicola]KAI0505927.1 hypothetical protein F5B22DRAFT_651213 [Xylaria bambusicola]